MRLRACFRLGGKPAGHWKIRDHSQHAPGANAGLSSIADAKKCRTKYLAACQEFAQICRDTFQCATVQCEQQDTDNACTAGDALSDTLLAVHRCLGLQGNRQ